VAVEWRRALHPHGSLSLSLSLSMLPVGLTGLDRNPFADSLDDAFLISTITILDLHERGSDE
jgi:hypothetical protein